MGYVIKHSTSNVNKARRKGNVAIGVDSEGYNKTSVSGFYNGVPPVEGKHNFVQVPSTGTPNFYCVDDTELVNYVNSLGAGIYTVTEALSFLTQRTDIVFTNNIVKNIVTDGLVLDLNSQLKSSFLDNSPTVNTANTTGLATYWNNSGTAIWNSNDTQVRRLFSNLPVFSMLKTTNGNSHIGIGSTSAAVDTEYTYSVYVWIPSSNSAGMSGSPPYMRPQPANYLEVTLSYNGSTSWGTWPRDQWIRIEGTGVTNSTASGTVTSAYISCYLNTAGDKIYFTAPQFEQKSSATDFVNGTRSQNTTWHDLSGNGYDFTLYNGLSYDEKGLIFDGTSDYASSDSTIDLTTTQKVTVVSVFKVESGDNPMIYEHTNNWNTANTYNKTGGGTTSYGGFGLVPNSNGSSVSNNTNHVQLKGNNGYGGINTNINLNGKYTYNAVVYDFTNSAGSTQTFHYVNGELITNTGTSYGAGSSQYFGNDYIWLGKRGTSNPSSPMRLSKLQIYNKALSQAEINQNYYGGDIVTDGLVLAIDAGNLVSYESGSTTAYSMTGSNSGTLTNGTGYSSNNGGSFVFDGTNDYITATIPSSTSLRCLETWFYNENIIPGNDTAIGGPTSYQSLYNFNGNYPMGINLGAWTGQGTNEAIQIWSNTSSPWRFTYTRDAVPSGWHHLVFNWNGSTYDIYLDGVIQTVYASSGGHATLISLNSLVIGNHISPNYAFNGKIPITRIYNQSLTDAEVLQNYNAQKARFI